MNEFLASEPMAAAERMTGFTALQLVVMAVVAVLALLVIIVGARGAARRRAAERELEASNDAYHVPVEQRVTMPITAPPEPAIPFVTEEAPPAPPRVAPEPVPMPADESPSFEPADTPPPPLPVMPEPAPEPEPQVADPLAPDPLGDEPIAAAAPMDASPASLAADVAAEPEPAAEPASAPEPQPEPAPPAPEPAASSAADDLTRMKGVGPRLADRLYAVGVTSFAQIAALTPDEAAQLDARMGDFQGRLDRDRWIEQAQLLAAGDIAGYEEKFGKL